MRLWRARVRYCAELRSAAHGCKTSARSPPRPPAPASRPQCRRCRDRTKPGVTSPCGGGFDARARLGAAVRISCSNEAAEAPARAARTISGCLERVGRLAAAALCASTFCVARAGRASGPLSQICARPWRSASGTPTSRAPGTRSRRRLPRRRTSTVRWRRARCDLASPALHFTPHPPHSLPLSIPGRGHRPPPRPPAAPSASATVSTSSAGAAEAGAVGQGVCGDRPAQAGVRAAAAPAGRDRAAAARLARRACAARRRPAGGARRDAPRAAARGGRGPARARSPFGGGAARAAAEHGEQLARVDARRAEEAEARRPSRPNWRRRTRAPKARREIAAEGRRARRRRRRRGPRWRRAPPRVARRGAAGVGAGGARAVAALRQQLKAAEAEAARAQGGRRARQVLRVCEGS